MRDPQRQEEHMNPDHLITRRDALRQAASGTLAVAAAGSLAACGSSSSASSATSTGRAGAPRRGGALKVGMTGGGGTDTLSSFNAVTAPDYARAVQLYEPLVRMNAQGHPELALAEELSPNHDATRWDIRLHQGATFHNGKDVTAADVLYTLQAITNPKSPGEAASSLARLNVPQAKQLDKYTLSVPCHAPFATFPQALSIVSFSGIVPVGYDVHHPIGAGPFKMGTFTPGTQSTFERFADYWKSPLPYADSLVITEFADETSQVNALLAGQLDAITFLSAASINQVQGNGHQVVISPGGGWNPFVMRTDLAPFNDVRVRQALRLVVDRQAMLNTVFLGHGTLGNDVMGIWAPEYDHSLPQRTQDLEQAKSLLKAAGRENLTLQLVVADVAQGVLASAQVFAQQAQGAGVTVNLRQTTVTNFFGPNYLHWQFSMDQWYYDLYFPAVALATIPTAPFWETHYDNPRYTSLYNRGVATLDESARADLAHEMQHIEYTDGPYIIPFFAPVIDGHSRHVQGAVPAKNGAPFNEFDFKSLWLATA
jgi:peptide/nickel transport system substrate-binding protein